MTLIEKIKYISLIVLFILFWLYQEHLKSSLKKGKQKNARVPPHLHIASIENTNGIIFGKRKNKLYSSPIEDEGHIFCCASTGAGKTSAIAIPSIRSACKDPSRGTCFCIDISGDIASNCDIPNKIVFDIENPATTPYNIFYAIDKEDNYNLQNELLEKLAFLIMPETNTSDDAGAFFLNNGRKMLIGALIAYYHEGLDFVPICKKIVSFDYKTLLYDIVRINNQDAILYISSFAGANERNSAGCKQCVDVYISLYSNNFRMSNAIRRPKDNEPCVTPQLLKNHSIFLCIPDAKTDIYGPFLGVASAQAFDYCAARQNHEKPTILFILDELSSLRLRPSDLTNALKKSRKRAIRLCCLTQSLLDLDILYGSKVRDTILNNIKYKVILGITDPESQRYFSDIIGKQDVETKSTTISSRSRSVSYGHTQEYCVPPDEFGRLKDELYLICDDGSYIKLQKNYYFK